MDMDRFTLEGKTYYQQGRQCGRAGCKCQEGELHGPYWYTRDQQTGRVSYVGRALPAAVATARHNYDLLKNAMYRARNNLKAALDATHRLLRGDQLSTQDKLTLHALGFGDALVQIPGEPGTQDAALVSAGIEDHTQDAAQDAGLHALRHQATQPDIALCAARLN